ncbi:MAG TPA: hypothetical protein VJU18_09905 [Vicinamibacteria bacterium]|nr:hypothetical protein [Vicinamibacteria bacterium]
MLPLVFASTLLAAAVSNEAEVLRLKLSAPAELSVGEPMKLTVEWSTTRPIEVVTAKAQVWLDDGMGFRPYHETSFGTGSTVHFPELITPSATIVTEHVIAVSGYAAGPDEKHFALAFPRAGRYQVKVQYKDAVSNVAAIRVVLPKGKDAELLSRYLLHRPELLSEWGLIEDFGASVLEQALQEHRGSRYLAHSKVLLWKTRLEEARASDRRIGAKLTEGKVSRLLEEMGTDDLEDSPFEEDRLLLLAETAAAVGDRAKARASYERILAKHPKSHAAMKAKRWMADEEAMAADREEAVVK